MNVFDVSVVTDVCPRINLQDKEAITPSRARSFTFSQGKRRFTATNERARLEFEFSYCYHITVELLLT